MILLVIFAVAAIVIGYVRLSPSDPAIWHIDLDVTRDEDLAGGVRRLIDPADTAVFARLNDLIEVTPRTKPIAGDVQSGRVTYVTRSLVIGFPDYTTIALVDGRVMIFARLRFGRSDMGVNRRRVDQWIAGLEP